MTYSYSGFGRLGKILDFSVSENEGTYHLAGTITHDCCGGDFSTTKVCCRGETLIFQENHDCVRFFAKPSDIPFCLADQCTDSGIHLHKPPVFDRSPLAQTFLEDRGIFYQVVTVTLQKARQWHIYIYDPDCVPVGTSLRYDPIAQMDIRRSENEYVLNLEVLRELPSRMHLACLSLPYVLGLLPDHGSEIWD